jgi:HSP20 family protein
MTAYLWDPFAVFARLDREFDEIVRRTWGTPERARTLRSGFIPAADVVTDGDDVIVHLELPGVDIDKDVTVELDGGRLVVRGERTETRTDDSHAVVTRERRHGAFQREFNLPDSVGAEQISATYDNGILSVRLAGAMTVNRSRRIPVAAGAPTVPAVSRAGGSTPDASGAAAPAAPQTQAADGTPAA